MVTKLTVHTGYTITEQQQTVSLYDAFQILSTKARRRYTKAVRHGDTATLYKHLYHCPHCGKAAPAYDHILFHDAKPPVIDKCVLATWAQLQTSMFDDTPALLPIQSPTESTNVIPCPHCHELTDPDTHQRALRIETTATGITLDCDGRRLVTDLAHGDFYTILHCPNSDYRRQPTHEQSDRFFVDLINDHHIVRRHIRRSLSPFWPHGFPYSANELSYSHCKLLTTFVNFPRCFYDEIPMIATSEERDPSLLTTANFRTPDEAQALFARSPLSRYKSLRRAIFRRPSLLFYLHELEWLFTLLDNVDRLHTVLNYAHLLWLLNFLHHYSATWLYFEDYTRAKGSNALCRLLSDFKNSYQDCYHDAVEYALKNPFDRRQIQNNGFLAIEQTRVVIPLDIPSYLQNDRLDGFVFYCLKNTAECHKVGLKMNNCLSDWNHSSPVIAVYRHKRVVAAIEVNDHRIVQAYQPYNQPIEANSPLHNAIDKWCRKYDIQWFTDEEYLPY